ncbi:phage tail-collar fiber domain-containing protein [Citrobacter portucalensis]|uniref:phage tail-collar fiber domain-containing protein n=1 Tax=Citrobacter portucalensis TaxID=1639133 RepID=UPI00226B4FE5|nr:phage tail protein [Citrobacter portucalensis]MCX8983521.1 phage tail protein [Citrobacter portucalensis]
MSQAVITTAFERLKAQQAASGAAVVLDGFIFAHVPNLDDTTPIDPTEAIPAAAQIVHRADVSMTGVVNENAVVYSVTLGTSVGDFDFNWVGLVNKASNTLAMIVHAPVQNKVANASGVQGNVLTRSFLMEYDGAKKQTEITTPAATWQIDFTARLAGMDDRVRVENVDMYGHGVFLGDGFLVKRNGNNYSITVGSGYVGGLRTSIASDQTLAVTTKPVKVWVDTCFTGTLTSVWQVQTAVTLADTLADYVKDDVKHYVFAVATINADGSVTDLRPNARFLRQDQNLQDIQDKAKARAALELKNAALKEIGLNDGQVPEAQNVFKNVPIKTITDGDDFNTFTITGYYNISTDDLLKISHRPVNKDGTALYSYGHLIVFSDGYVVTQVYISHDAEVAQRQSWGNNWKDWSVSYTSKKPPTPTDVGALPSDGNAVSATKLVTARKIAGKLFDGSADITLGPDDVDSLPGYVLGGIVDGGSFAAHIIPGFYWTSIDNSSTVADMPVRRNGTPCYGYGSLFVIPAGNAITQIYVSDNGDFATRQYWGNWHVWKVMYSEASRPTPDDIGAYTKAEVDAHFVADVQLGAGTSVTTWNTSGKWPNSPGYIITSVFKDNMDQNLDGVVYAPLQKKVGSQWYTVQGGV